MGAPWRSRKSAARKWPTSAAAPRAVRLIISGDEWCARRIRRRATPSLALSSTRSRVSTSSDVAAAMTSSLAAISSELSWRMRQGRHSDGRRLMMDTTSCVASSRAARALPERAAKGQSSWTMPRGSHTRASSAADARGAEASSPSTGSAPALPRSVVRPVRRAQRVRSGARAAAGSGARLRARARRVDEEPDDDDACFASLAVRLPARQGVAAHDTSGGGSGEVPPTHNPLPVGASQPRAQLTVLAHHPLAQRERQAVRDGVQVRGAHRAQASVRLFR